MVLNRQHRNALRHAVVDRDVLSPLISAPLSLVRCIRPPERLRLGTALSQLGRRVGLTGKDFAAFEQVRDKTPAEPVSFE